ncbi:MAG: helix-hairpin-helix domain-containing protein [Deltaproteobacteria bacterium]|nr:helix-hairpin-helix domain-containing protein [Deltaproteobacteria bacterium]
MRKSCPFTMLFAVLLLFAFGSTTVTASGPAVSMKLKTERVDLNRASAEQLCALPGIGEKKAQAIIDYRLKKGNFSAVEDLLRVKGIGEKLFEKIKPRVMVSVKHHDLSH